MRKVIKVVRRWKDKLYSIAVYRDTECCIIYAEGKMVSSTSLIQGSKLFAFETVEQAIECAEKNFWSSAEVWEAETTNAVPGDSMAQGMVLAEGIMSHIKMFWEGTLPSKYTLPSPDGTLYCDDIKLTRKIRDVDFLSYVRTS